MIMMTIRYDWPGDVPVTEWLTGSEQEVVILSADLFVDSNFMISLIPDHLQLMMIMTGAMVRQRQPCRWVLLQTLQDA